MNNPPNQLAGGVIQECLVVSQVGDIVPWGTSRGEKFNLKTRYWDDIYF